MEVRSKNLFCYLMATANYNYIGTQPAYTIPDTWSSYSNVSDFDTTSSVVGSTFESNISLVDPTVQFSRTEKRLVERGVSLTADRVKNPP